MLVALDKKTGAEIWSTKNPDGKAGAGYSSIVISNAANVKQYVQLVGQGLIGVSAENGKLLWNYNRIANSIANISTPLVRDDFEFASTAYEAGSALIKIIPAQTGGLKVQEVYYLPARTFQNHHGGMVLVGDYIYAGHGQKNGFPICLDWKTGRVMWGGDRRGPGQGSAAVTYADGRLYFRYEDGTMALIVRFPPAVQALRHVHNPRRDRAELAPAGHRRRQAVFARARCPVVLQLEMNPGFSDRVSAKTAQALHQIAQIRRRAVGLPIRSA